MLIPISLLLRVPKLIFNTEIIVKDVSGRTLKVGQKVKWAKTYWGKIDWYRGIVEKFTPKTVKIKFKICPLPLAKKFTYVQDPENRVVILEK